MSTPYMTNTELELEQAEQIGKLKTAIEAIIARIDGNWDHPCLVEFGPLLTDTLQDIKLIAVSVRQ